MIRTARAGGALTPGEAGMLSGVFHLHEQEARQVMTPIPAVVTVDTARTWTRAPLHLLGHTRLVVTEDGNRDRVRGIVHANSLAPLLIAEGPRASFDAAPARAPICPRPSRWTTCWPLDRDAPHGGDDRRVRPRGGDHHRRGHHRGGRRRDRRRDRPGRRSPSAAWPTATGSSAATSR